MGFTPDETMLKNYDAFIAELFAQKRWATLLKTLINAVLIALHHLRSLLFCGRAWTTSYHLFQRVIKYSLPFLSLQGKTVIYKL